MNAEDKIIIEWMLLILAILLAGAVLMAASGAYREPQPEVQYQRIQ